MLLVYRLMKNKKISIKMNNRKNMLLYCITTKVNNDLNQKSYNMLIELNSWA